eukprot:TRINITY_DN4297_c0_g1_i1.p2 TRINITY_DN4297_c0_g1~~TRINITY_DN4297_c0_g1_i1.p2  ORF type:complete len:96 (+),score=22.36 TRINITY_DN4297_c0_g1_i1:592-879(+)
MKQEFPEDIPYLETSQDHKMAVPHLEEAPPVVEKSVSEKHTHMDIEEKHPFEHEPDPMLLLLTDTVTEPGSMFDEPPPEVPSPLVQKELNHLHHL